MSTVQIVLRVAAADEEIAVAHVIDLAPGGFRHEGVAGSDEVEFGIYLPRDDVHEVLAGLMAAAVPVLDVDVQPVDDDWNERWKDFHQPVMIGGMWVGPPWQLDDAPVGTPLVVIEPGQGFGTGAHPTTRLVLELLAEQPRCSVLDIGCGSGVLAIAASLLGFAPIVAIDNDPAAIQSTLENLERNNIVNVTTELLDPLAGGRLPQTDLVLANLTLEPLRGLAHQISAPRILASGLLRSQVDEASAMYAAEGYVVQERRDRDGWAALVLQHTDENRAMRHRDLF